jgi:hypothetical protein
MFWIIITLLVIVIIINVMRIPYILSDANKYKTICEYYKEWKDNYYRDKDLLMKKEKFIHRIFRFIKNL